MAVATACLATPTHVHIELKQLHDTCLSEGMVSRTSRHICQQIQIQVLSDQVKRVLQVGLAVCRPPQVLLLSTSRFLLLCSTLAGFCKQPVTPHTGRQAKQQDYQPVSHPGMKCTWCVDSRTTHNPLPLCADERALKECQKNTTAEFVAAGHEKARAIAKQLARPHCHCQQCSMPVTACHMLTAAHACQPD